MQNCEYWVTLAISRAYLKSHLILRNIGVFLRNFQEIFVFFDFFLPDLLLSHGLTYPVKISARSEQNWLRK